MNDQTTNADASTSTAHIPAGLLKLREAVPEHLISPLPKGTQEQNKCDAKDKINCKVCGGWHHHAIKHLDYVGHAAATKLLLDADMFWNWEPMAVTEQGLPMFDNTGGLWIRLTVCGLSRIGYGNAAPSSIKDVGAREKEVIGDALRNAAMRFGLALDLWSKADLHSDEGGGDDDRHTPPPPPPPPKPPAEKPQYTDEQFAINLKAWGVVIEGGRKTADQIIAQAETAKTLTAQQRAAIRKFKPAKKED